MEKSYMHTGKNHFTPGMISLDLIFCPHCHTGVSNQKIIHAGGKETNTPRYHCKECNKRFSIRHQSINWKIHFPRLYLLFFNKVHERNAIRARYNDFMISSTKRDFDSRLRHYRRMGLSMEDTIEKTFLDILKALQIKAYKKRDKEIQDNWEIIINFYDSEKIYELNWKLLKAENDGISYSDKKNTINPLVHCHKCHNSDVTKNGFSPIGRRRFKCKNCEITFVLRMEHIFSFSYVKTRVLEILIRLVPGKIKSEYVPLLEEMGNKIAIEFMHPKHLNTIGSKLHTQFLIHEEYRVREVEEFVKKISKKYTFIPMEALPVKEQDSSVSKVLLLGQTRVDVSSEYDISKFMLSSVFSDISPHDSDT